MSASFLPIALPFLLAVGLNPLKGTSYYSVKSLVDINLRRAFSTRGLRMWLLNQCN